MMRLISWIYAPMMILSPQDTKIPPKASRNQQWGLGFHVEGLQAKEDALNLEYKGLNMEANLKYHGLGL